ncbi:alginate lyase family protein [Candidatus Omnitrophota bacterium]
MSNHAEFTFAGKTKNRIHDALRYHVFQDTKESVDNIKSLWANQDLKKPHKYRVNDFFVFTYALLNGEPAASIIKYLRLWKEKYAGLEVFSCVEPLECSIRLNNLLWIYYIGSDSIERGDREFLLTLIRLQADLTDLFCEHRNHNNHIFIQGKNLLLAGLLFSDRKLSQTWLRKGQQTVHSCLKYQIDDNGVHIERSRMYQKVILSELLELTAIIKACSGLIDAAFKDFLYAKVKTMLEYDRIITHCNGKYSLWGDGYFGDRLIRFVPVVSSYDKCADYEKNILAWRSCLNLPVFDLEPTQLQLLTNRSGFIYSRFEDYALEINAGTALTKQDFAKGHIHSDILSFTLSKGDKEVIGHAGTYAYDEQSIKYFRGTRGHNTIMVDGLEQHGNQDKSSPYHYADGCLLKCECVDNADIIEVSHNGYKRIGVTHKRGIKHIKHEKFIEVVDTIAGMGKHGFEAFLHFAQGLECSISGNRVCIKDHAEIVIDAPPGVTLELLFARDGAYYSKSFYNKVPAYLFRASGNFFNNVTIRTKIFLK